MTNVLNNIIANQPIKPPKQAVLPAFSFDSDGRVKPLEDKAKLLPSRIFGSPIEYAKDLKQDVVNIGRAAKGKANDHELGRINDVAMKLGALGLAGYLFVKNPLKLSKTMEFVGLGTFFGAMSLWPKLAIQAPIKARTGVDVHQKYIDSQGRKKMLHQDPQYDLTDLYSREDLDRMGKKLGVSEDLPDRDNFIKQRAKKTATQANTLWMMTAGFATPLMSALACNRLEKPLTNLFEKFDLTKSEKVLKEAMKAASKTEVDEKIITFLQQNSGKKMDDNLAQQLSKMILGTEADESLLKALQTQLTTMKVSKPLNLEFVTAALKDNKKAAGLIAGLSDEGKTALADAIKTGKVDTISKVLSQASGLSKTKQADLAKSIKKSLEHATAAGAVPTIGEATEGIKKMASALGGFASGNKAIGKFVEARVGDKSGTYIANQWQRVCDSLFKSMKLKGKDLKALANGDQAALRKILEGLASDEGRFDEAVGKLMSMIDDFDTTAGSGFVSNVSSNSSKIGSKAAKSLAEGGFDDLAKAVGDSVKGTAAQKTVKFASDRAAGARSSFYRLMQSLNLFKRVQDGSFQTTLKTLLTEAGKNADDDAIARMIELSKKIMLEATSTSYIEKLQTTGFEKIAGKAGVTPDEYKIVMKALFGKGSEEALEKALKKSTEGGKATRMMDAFRSYQDDFMTRVVNYKNTTKPVFSQFATSAKTSSEFGTDLVGKKMTDFFQETARKSYNSKTWLKIFGGSFAALTAITLVAGLAIGRKGKMEKQVEAESKKVNG